jgi:hypothetical protein
VDVDRHERRRPVLVEAAAGRGDEEVEQVVLAALRVDQHEPTCSRPGER